MKIGDKITVTGTKKNPSAVIEFNSLSEYPFDAELLEADEESTDDFYIETPFWSETDNDNLCALSHFNYVAK